MKKTVLVIERDEDILVVIETVLLEQNYHVISSKTESGMIQRIAEIKPDVVILDVIRPTADGTELCKGIKSTEIIKHIPVIVLSTHFDIRAFKSDCADDVLAKPFNIDDLIDILEKQTA